MEVPTPMLAGDHILPGSVPGELTIRTPDGKARKVALDNKDLTLGRSATTDLCYADDSGLSRQHLVIEMAGSRWQIRDLNSKNGTVVNGQRLGTDPLKLKPGDRISAGHLIVEFEVPGSTGGGLDGSAPVSTGTVVFVDRAAEPISASTTVQASLEGLMGPEKVDPTKTMAFTGSPQMRALVRAGRELASHRPLEEVFQVIMDLSMEAVAAGRGVLMTLEGDKLELRAMRGEGFQISSTVRDRVLKERASVMVRDTSLEEAFRERKSIVQQQIKSMIAVPLQTNDRVIGLIYLDSPNVLRQFTREDLSLLTVMANVAAIRIEHARLNEIEQTEQLYAKELAQAAQIQTGLLPAQAPSVDGYTLGGFNVPCRTVGGDYYDFMPFPDGQLATIVGDVSGKGLAAALMMTSLQARCQILFDGSASLAADVGRLNTAVTRNCPAGKFITFFIGVLNPASGSFTYCNAGHNPPLIVRANGTIETLPGGGVVLGILPVYSYDQESVQLNPGDVAVLYSDGVTENFAADRDEEFGEDRLAQVIHQHRLEPIDQIIQHVCEAVQSFTSGAPAADDFTLVLIRRDV
ncbi:MAG TPA: SpoIIE family protein phosphatase [Bryobacteraceae bacterium]